MAVCVLVDMAGALTATATAPSSCAGYVMLTPGEFADAMAGPAWAISASDGALISVSILVTWALGWGFRAVADLLNDVQSPGDENA